MGKALETLLNENGGSNQASLIRARKERGEKVIGWMCRYVPTELIQAAGMFPLRILGHLSEEHVMGDAYLSIITCPFCRSVIDSALKGEYRELDGIVSVNSCCSMNRLMDVWGYYLKDTGAKSPLIQLMDLPYVADSGAIQAFRGELEGLKRGLEGLRGKEITEEELRRAMKLGNRTRQLLSELYALRKGPSPLLSGSEALTLVLAGMSLPAEEYDGLLEEAIQEIQGKESTLSGLPRVIVSGSLLADPLYLKMIEEQGAVVVTDDFCTGSRYGSPRLDLEAEPLEALSRGYLESVPCSRMLERKKRFDALLRMIEEYQVDGVIYSVLKFCQTYQYDFPHLEACLKERGIPILKLEREYTLSGAGQMKTRVQAFLEMLSSD